MQLQHYPTYHSSREQITWTQYFQDQSKSYHQLDKGKESRYLAMNRDWSVALYFGGVSVHKKDF